jgi:AcrR family transcriptional regulator
MDDKRRLILDQALALVDERGLAAMSMRAVAERVGLTSMALYPYVGGKDALLDGLVDLLHLELGKALGNDLTPEPGPAPTSQAQPLTSLAQPPTSQAQPPTSLAQPPISQAQPPTEATAGSEVGPWDAAGPGSGARAWAVAADIDWRQRLRALGRAVRALAHAHPSAFPLLLNRSAAGASASWLTAALRGILHDAGVSDAEVPRLARMICAFLLGYTTGEVTGGLPRILPPDAADSTAAATGAAEADTAGTAETAAAGAAGPDTAGTAETDAASVGAPGRSSAKEFDADLEDLVALVANAVCPRAGDRR